MCRQEITNTIHHRMTSAQRNSLHHSKDQQIYVERKKNHCPTRHIFMHKGSVQGRKHILSTNPGWTSTTNNSRERDKLDKSFTTTLHRPCISAEWRTPTRERERKKRNKEENKIKNNSSWRKKKGCL